MILDALERTPSDHRLHLFDSFAGLPAPGARDLHAIGDFADTSVAAVRARFATWSNVAIHPGCIPKTFLDSGLVSVAFAHVDLDLEQRCPRMFVPLPATPAWGVILFDEYGFRSCPGARAAVDGFISDLPEVPLILAAGKAVVTRLPSPPSSTRRLQ